jgi:hypothetical protein
MQLTNRHPRPAALASELADAQAKHNAEVAASKQRLADKRDWVVQRATDRVQAVRELQRDLKTEEQALSDLIKAA